MQVYHKPFVFNNILHLFLVCKEVKPLGMESKGIPDDRVTASTVWSTEYSPAKRARLGNAVAWYPKVSDAWQFLQV